MGDLIGQEVGGQLVYVPQSVFDSIRRDVKAPLERTRLFALLCRINALYMIARAGSGHIGSSFSSLDIISWLILEAMAADDILFSSKGHDAPAFYSVNAALGRLDFEKLHSFRRLGGLPGHPDVSVPGFVVNSGSLGMGISKAKGMIQAHRLTGRHSRLYVLTGDGELQEGQIWESLATAANDALSELTVIVDHNKLQSDTLVAKISDLGDLEAKFRAFGWHVERCDGHDLPALAQALAAGKDVAAPKVIIADTIKGRGVSFMEHTAFDSDTELYKYHSGSPGEEAYQRAVTELLEAARTGFASAGLGELSLEAVERPSRPMPNAAQRLIPAYSDALMAHAAANPSLVVLDADLALDTGVLPFKAAYPSRFFECGIAEQDMVSQAGGMALAGLLPVVHSFACFLSSRPNEQIYTNATERTKVVYVGSLAGVVPGGPGHSHQAVRDISSLAAVPGLVMIEPSCEAEVALALDYCINACPTSSYLRLISVPWPQEFDLPADYRLERGKGVMLKDGKDVVVFTYGPIMLGEALKAASSVEAVSNATVKVVNLPWLNEVDPVWLAEITGSCSTVVTIDNHYVLGGQGDRIAIALAETGLASSRRLLRFGLNDVPLSGGNDEVLAVHGLDAPRLAEAWMVALSDHMRG